ncbi:hypothetical protein Y1Q_0019280 [Alligator mississippiensis]|nr:hypothetical protein Y1Q_0019280 [Alligator mississippiensis]
MIAFVFSHTNISLHKITGKGVLSLFVIDLISNISIRELWRIAILEPIRAGLTPLRIIDSNLVYAGVSVEKKHWPSILL